MTTPEDPTRQDQPDPDPYLAPYRMLISELNFRRADFRQKVNGILTRAGIMVSGNLALVGLIVSRGGCYSLTEIVSVTFAGIAILLCLPVLVVPSKPSISIPGLEQYALQNPRESMFSKVLIDKLGGDLSNDENRLKVFRLFLIGAIIADLVAVSVYEIGSFLNV